MCEKKLYNFFYSSRGSFLIFERITLMTSCLLGLETFFLQKALGGVGFGRSGRLGGREGPMKDAIELHYGNVGSSFFGGLTILGIDSKILLNKYFHQYLQQSRMRDIKGIAMYIQKLTNFYHLVYGHIAQPVLLQL